MGEFALYKGESVKIGTCEEMMYLRWGQRGAVEPERGSTNPMSREAREHCLWRFPFPDEDGTPPGAYGGLTGLTLWGCPAPEGGDHGIVQYVSHGGYLLNGPCPEATGGELPMLPDGFKLFKNGYHGAVKLMYQRWWEGRLVGVLQCVHCRRLWRMPTFADAAGAMEALASMAEREIATADQHGTEGNRQIGERFIECAWRLRNGYFPEDQR